jgi:hypothetical protein
MSLIITKFCSRGDAETRRVFSSSPRRRGPRSVYAFIVGQTSYGPRLRGDDVTVKTLRVSASPRELFYAPFGAGVGA